MSNNSRVSYLNQSNAYFITINTERTVGVGKHTICHKNICIRKLMPKPLCSPVYFVYFSVSNISHSYRDTSIHPYRTNINNNKYYHPLCVKEV